MTTQILLASNNPHKLIEFRQILGDSFEVLSPADLGLTLDVDETGSTFEENAVLKAEALSRVSGLPTIADDSGLVIDALGGEPGVYSARYGGPEKTDRDRVELVLERLDGIPPEARTARFVSAIGLCRLGSATEVVRGEVDGRITERARGTEGFGYDPIFLYPPSGLTFGEMDALGKAAVSHRGRALRRMRARLEGQYTEGDSTGTGDS